MNITSSRYTTPIRNILLIAFASIVAGYRDNSIAIDTENYKNFFYSSVECECIQNYFEVGFNHLTYIISFLTKSAEIYLSVISFCILYGLLLISKYIYKRNEGKIGNSYIYDSWVLIFIFSSTFIFSATVNGLRQGLAAPLIIFTIALTLDGKIFKAIITGIAAASIHKSSILYLAFMPILLMPSKYFITTFILSSLIYLTGLSDPLTSIISNKLNLTIYNDIVDYSETALYSGFNLGFYLYSHIPIILLIIAYKYRINFLSEIFYLFRIYGVLIMPYFYFGFASYANRYAFTAWILIPQIYTLFFFIFIEKTKFMKTLLSQTAIAAFIFYISRFY